MINLKPPIYSLADAFEFVEKNKYPLARTISKSQLNELTKINPAFNEPTHQGIQVRLRHQSNQSRVLLYTILGYPYFSIGDVLEDFKLPKKEFFFDYLIDNNSKNIYQSHEIDFNENGTKDWKAQFNFETIFEYYGLDGENEFAPFVGIFKIK